MKKFFFFAAAAAAAVALATSCAPSVRTLALKTYPAVSPDSVVVYSRQHLVPEGAEALGTVIVRDGGFTTQCDSLTVVSCVKLETGKMGGNAALITEHVRPSFWGSTCHQMTATSLFVGGALRQTDTSLAAQLANVKMLKPGRTLPHARFAANAGYGRRTAKISPDLSDNERWLAEQLTSGLAWEASAAYFFNDWLGLGFDYSGYRATASAPNSYFVEAPHITGILHITNVVTYIGPAWVTRFALSPSWILEGNLGVGYVDYRSISAIQNVRTKIRGNTVGTRLSVGVDCKLSKSWAIGVNMQTQDGLMNECTFTDIYGKTSSEKLEEGKYEGLGQLRLQAGLRYYIK